MNRYAPLSDIRKVGENMLAPGTKVFVKKLPANGGNRIEPSFDNKWISDARKFQKEFMIIECHCGDDYYMLRDKYNGACIVHEQYLVNMETYVPQFNIGDTVEILPIAPHTKESYLYDWINEMWTYVGKTARIQAHRDEPDCYELEGIPYVWCADNLKLSNTFVGY